MSIDHSSQLRSLSGVQPLGDYVRELWKRREFTWSLATGSLRSEHLDTMLGNAWHVLNPALLIAVYYLIFAGLLNADRGLDNFIGFLAVGMFTFSFAQRSVSSCGASISNNVGLIRSLQFPRAVLPIAAVIRETTSYGFAALVMLGVMLATGEFPSLAWLQAPFIVVLYVMFNAGVGMVVARLTDSVRDLANVIPFVFRLLFYLSGILFSIDAFVTQDAVDRLGLPIDANLLKQLFVFDPYFTFIDLLRGSLMSSYETLYPFESWAFVLIISPITFLAGIAYFRSGEKTYGRG